MITQTQLLTPCTTVPFGLTRLTAHSWPHFLLLALKEANIQEERIRGDRGILESREQQAADLLLLCTVSVYSEMGNPVRDIWSQKGTGYFPGVCTPLGTLPPNKTVLCEKQAGVAATGQAPSTRHLQHS